MTVGEKNLDLSKALYSREPKRKAPKKRSRPNPTPKRELVWVTPRRTVGAIATLFVWNVVQSNNLDNLENHDHLYALDLAHDAAEKTETLSYTVDELRGEVSDLEGRLREQDSEIDELRLQLTE